MSSMDDMKEKFANFKEQVRQAADIVSIVSETVDLKRKGSRYWGCCPFHGEKTPLRWIRPEGCTTVSAAAQGEMCFPM